MNAPAVKISRPDESVSPEHFAKALRKKFHVFVKCRSSNSLEITMKTNPIAQDSGWDFSLGFAVSSPLLGVLLAMLAFAIFCR